jgi:alginate O-acetyltransferase complex protein AlgI
LVIWLSASRGRGSKARLLLDAPLLLILGLLGLFRYAGWLSELMDGPVGGLGLGSSPVRQLALPRSASRCSRSSGLATRLTSGRGSGAARARPRPTGLRHAVPAADLTGPIVRYGESRTQLQSLRITSPAIASGRARFSIGLAQKLLIGDQPMSALPAGAVSHTNVVLTAQGQ